MASRISHRSEGERSKTLIDCWQLLWDENTIAGYIELNKDYLLYGVETTRRWLNIIKLIDKHLTWEEKTNGRFFIELQSANYKDNVDMYVTFIMLRWIWMYKGAIPEVFKVREQTKMIWFKCIQAVHNIACVETNGTDAKQYLGTHHNFSQGMPGNRSNLFTYKAFIALSKTRGRLNTLWDKRFQFSGEYKDFLEERSLDIENVVLTKEQFDLAKSELSSMYDKEHLYVVFQRIDQARIGSIWLKSNVGNGKRIISFNGSAHSLSVNKDSKGNYTQYNIDDIHCLKVKFSKVKIKD